VLGRQAGEGGGCNCERSFSLQLLGREKRKRQLPPLSQNESSLFLARDTPLTGSSGRRFTLNAHGGQHLAQRHQALAQRDAEALRGRNQREFGQLDVGHARYNFEHKHIQHKFYIKPLEIKFFSLKKNPISLRGLQCNPRRFLYLPMRKMFIFMDGDTQFFEATLLRAI